MKEINLFSLINAREDLEDKHFIKYLEQFGINPRIRTSEIYDLKNFVNELSKYCRIPHIYNNYYVGFMIKQIGKEFDLLRIGENSVINIELKRMSHEEKAKKQLIQNRHYLKFLDIPVYNFTYISYTNKLYLLTENEELKETTFHNLVKKLKAQVVREIEDLNNLFDPTHYLVSPFNSPDAFMQDKYFLSAQQSTYKREILSTDINKQSVFSIVGGPGTGKSLLTYDIAKEYLRQGKKVLIFNCGKLNTGHETLINKYKWPIEPIQNFHVSNFPYKLSEYDLIIFDEAQRIHKEKFLKFVKLLNEVKLKCILSYDPNQVLTIHEVKDNIPKLIKEVLNPMQFELTEIIRHNKEIHAFITKLFDLRKAVNVEKFENVTIQYFSSLKATKSYLYYLKRNGWNVIDYTNKKYIDNPDNEHQLVNGDYIPDIIGQELDYVACVLDDYFYYKPNQVLAAKPIETKTLYQPTKMLYQNISRTRKKLHIVVNNNSDILGKILSILN